MARSTEPRLPASSPPLARWIALALAAACALVFTPQASAADPANVYLQAYLTMQKGQRLLEAGDAQGGLRKLEEASQVFDSVSRNYPRWNPQMVQYRRKTIRSLIGQARGKLGSSAVPDAGDGLITGSADAPLPTPSPGESAIPPRPSVIAVPSGAEMGNATTAQDFLARLNQSIHELSQQNGLLREQLARKENSLRDAQEQAAAAARSAQQLREKLAASEARMEDAKDSEDEVKTLREEVGRLKQQIAGAATDMESAGEQTQKIIKELEDAREQITQLQKEKDDLRSERDQMAAVLQAKDLNPNSVEALRAENIRLQSQLKEAQGQIAKLQKEAGEKDEEIAKLRSEVVTIKAELARLREENGAYEQQVASLKQQLADVKQDLAAVPENDLELAEENRVLRGIIVRNLAAQARQMQAKRLVIQEMEKLDVKSETLIDRMRDMTASYIVLTEREKEMFREPQIQDLINTGGFTATLVAEAREAFATPGAVADTAGVPKLSDAAPPEADPGEVSRLSHEAGELYKARRYEDAEKAYERVVRIDPQNVDNLAGLAASKLSLDKTAEAEVALKKALAYEPENARCHFMLGVSFFRDERWEEALRSIERSVEIEPENPKALNYVGVIASRVGLPKRAEEALAKAVELKPDYGDAHYNLAVHYATTPEPVMHLASMHYQKALDHGASRDPEMDKLLSEGAERAPEPDGETETPAPPPAADEGGAESEAATAVAPEGVAPTEDGVGS